MQDEDDSKDTAVLREYVGNAAPTLDLELKRELIRRVTHGDRPFQVALELGIPKSTLAAECLRDVAFSATLDAARRTGVHWLVDNAHEIAVEEIDVARAKLRVDLIKWHAARLKPKSYGDRIDIAVEHTLRINQAIDDARTRAGITRDVTPAVEQNGATGYKPVAVPGASVPSLASAPLNAPLIARETVPVGPITRRGEGAATPGALVKGGALQGVLKQKAAVVNKQPLTRARDQNNPFVDDEDVDPFD